MLSRQPPHVHPSSPFTGEEGGQGESEGRQLSITVPRTMLAMLWSRLSNSPGV